MIRLNAVIMAAGLSRRFGVNKLLLPLGGKPVITRVLDNFPFVLFTRTVIVFSHPEVRDIASVYPLLPVYNATPERGQSGSIRLGLEACEDADGTLFLVADQPLLKQVTIVTLAEAFRDNPEAIVIPQANGSSRNPVFFPRACLPQLKSLDGDTGGRVVIRQNPERLITVQFDDPEEFTDIDTPETYARLSRNWPPGEARKPA